MLTDTTFWIDLLKERRDRSNGPASEFLARNRSSAIEMSIITWGELAGGFESSAEMDNLFRGARILHLHVQVAWEASRIERELRDQGGNSEKTTIGSQRPPEYGDCGWYHETRPLPGFQIWI